MGSLEIQEKLLSLLPIWNYQIAKPFKQLLDEGISLDMYYCIKTLEWCGGASSMTQLANLAKMPKQQMTKMADRLVEQGFVARYDDPEDRRVVMIRLTDKAKEFIDYFMEHDASCFRPLLERMTAQDLEDFGHALDQLLEVFCRLPGCCGGVERLAEDADIKTGNYSSESEDKIGIAEEK